MSTGFMHLAASLLGMFLAVGSSAVIAQEAAPAQQQDPTQPQQSASPSNANQTQKQSAPANTPAPEQPATSYPIGPLNPQPVARPVQPIDSNSVNTTGGIINSHPVDIFNRSTTYTPPVAPAETAPEETTYPIEQLNLTPNLSEMNSNASSVQYKDHHAGPFNLAVDADWVLTSNLFDAFNGTPSVVGNYFDVSVPVGFIKKTATTNFDVYFRETNTFYPSYSSLNHSSQIYSQDLQHKSSALTTWDWSVAGGRVITLDDYLPPVIAIGNTGVVQSSLATGLLPLYNAASTLAVTHRLSEENTVIASGTVGWTQEPLSGATPTAPAFLNREITGGLDLQFQHAINAKQALGVEATNVYVDGLSPTGTSNFTSIEATFTQAFSQHGSLHAGIGPLYSHVASSLFPTQNDLSYTGDIGITYQTSFARFDAGYARLYQLGYLEPATVAHSFYAVVERPLTRTMDLTFDTRYLLSVSSPQYSGADYTDFGSTLRFGYNITPKTVFYVSGDTFRQSGQGLSIGRNDFTTGVSYSFSNPLSRSGAR